MDVAGGLQRFSALVRALGSLPVGLDARADPVDTLAGFGPRAHERRELALALVLEPNGLDRAAPAAEGLGAEERNRTDPRGPWPAQDAPVEATPAKPAPKKKAAKKSSTRKKTSKKKTSKA